LVAQAWLNGLELLLDRGRRHGRAALTFAGTLSGSRAREDRGGRGEQEQGPVATGL
jgi:hypothetical protein